MWETCAGLASSPAGAAGLENVCGLPSALPDVMQALSKTGGYWAAVFRIGPKEMGAPVSRLFC